MQQQFFFFCCHHHGGGGANRFLLQIIMTTTIAFLLLSLSSSTVTTVTAETFYIDRWSTPAHGNSFVPLVATVGDVIEFTWFDETHTVYIHPSMSCNDLTGSREVGTTSPSSYTFTDNDIGEVFFACQVDSHCLSGQHVTVTVLPLALPTTEEGIGGEAVPTEAPSSTVDNSSSSSSSVSPSSSYSSPTTSIRFEKCIVMEPTGRQFAVFDICSRKEKEEDGNCEYCQRKIVSLEEYISLTTEYHLTRLETDYCIRCEEFCWSPPPPPVMEEQQDIPIEASKTRNSGGAGGGGTATSSSLSSSCSVSSLLDPWDEPIVDCNTCSEQCQRYGYTLQNGYMDASVFSQCQMVYSPEDDNEPAFYAGPRCNDESFVTSVVTIGVFTDNQCQDFHSELNVDNYIVDQDGYQLKLTNDILKRTYDKDHSMSCLPIGDSSSTDVVSDLSWNRMCLGLNYSATGCDDISNLQNDAMNQTASVEVSISRQKRTTKGLLDPILEDVCTRLTHGKYNNESTNNPTDEEPPSTNNDLDGDNDDVVASSAGPPSTYHEGAAVGRSYYMAAVVVVAVVVPVVVEVIL